MPRRATDGFDCDYVGTLDVEEEEQEAKRMIKD